MKPSNEDWKTIEDERSDNEEYEQVFTHCNVCGRELIYVLEDEMGMCRMCAGK